MKILWLVLLLSVASFFASATEIASKDDVLKSVVTQVQTGSYQNTDPNHVNSANLTLVSAPSPELSATGGRSQAPVQFIVAAQPPKPVEHHFFDRTNAIGFAIHAAIRTADATQSCIMIGRGRQENWLPMKSCAGVATYSLSMIPAQIGASYLMHRWGHHRLERLMPYAWSIPSAAGIAVSTRSW